MAAPAPNPFTIRAATLDDTGEIARLLTELGHPTSADDVTARRAN